MSHGADCLGIGFSGVSVAFRQFSGDAGRECVAGDHSLDGDGEHVANRVRAE
jgi:hypothetical protein